MTSKTPVFGIIETGGNVIVKVTDWVTKRNAQKLIAQHVQSGATMVTDGFAMHSYQKEQSLRMLWRSLKGEYVKGGFHTNGDRKLLEFA